MDWIEEVFKEIKKEYKKEETLEDLKIRGQVKHCVKTLKIFKEELKNGGFSDEFAENIIIKLIETQLGGCKNDRQ